ncbi:MAG TPA: ModD protein [Syntrophomonadaceae bacterium]|nr:ModD protein [Syntrophomonadaceae bacterium]
MFYISDDAIDRLIKEDVPYLDLTTLVLGIGNKKGIIRFSSREFTVLAGVEEVLRIFAKLDIRTVESLPSGSQVENGETFIFAEGMAETLHTAWKVSLNILEYCSGVATRTRKLVDKAKSINPDISIVTTRKSFPGTKDLCMKSVIAGGGFPHRLGLSETILIFKQHVNFLGGFNSLPSLIPEIKLKAAEKKIIVEVETEEEAFLLASSGVDGIQFDKVPAPQLKALVAELRKMNPLITLIAAGGINEGNVAEYASTGVNALATSAVYFGKPSDIGVKIEQV